MTHAGPVFRSPLPDVAIPNVTVAGLIASAVTKHAERVALVDGPSGRTVTYRELGEAVERVAAGLAAGGLPAGGVAAIVAANSAEWMIAALGVIRCGGVLTAANPAATREELARQLTDSAACVVLTAPAVLDTVAAAAASCPGIDEMIVFGETVPSIAGRPARAFSALLDEDRPHPAGPADPDGVCLLPYSSGTTGLGKGVQLTHRNLVSNICQITAVSPVSAGDRILAFLPMFHVMGFSVVALAGLAAGATLVTLPAFEPRAFLSRIQDDRIDTVFVVPPVASFLSTHPVVDQFDLSSLRTLGCGAAPLAASTETRLAARIGCQVGQGYGMTESSGCISYPLLDRQARPGSSGVLLPNTEAMIIDPVTGEPAAPGATGELWFRGPQAFTGYLGHPQATAEMLDAEGWVHTGDLGTFDAAGYLYVTDRMKELIKVNAYQVPPAEIEALLLSHPAVTDAAVIGRPDERAGERPVAYVVTAADSDSSQILDWTAERLTEHKRLAAVICVDAIPKTPSGKILRRLLKDNDSAAQART